MISEWVDRMRDEGSQFEVEAEASVVLSVVLEGELEAVGAGRGEPGNVVLVLELDSVALVVGLLEVDGLVVEEDAVELDIDVDLREGSVISGSSNLNSQSSTTSMSLLDSLLGVAPMVSFSIVHCPCPQIVKGQLMALGAADWPFWKMVKADSEQTSARNTMADLLMFQL